MFKGYFYHLGIGSFFKAEFVDEEGVTIRKWAFNRINE